MRNLMLALLVVAMYALHQDLWFWDDARPLLFGALPIGLAYHVLYSIVVAGLMWLLVHYAWPVLSEIEAPGLRNTAEGPAVRDVEGPSHLERDR
jgi:hypothetical protein